LSEDEERLIWLWCDWARTEGIVLCRPAGRDEQGRRRYVPPRATGEALLRSFAAWRQTQEAHVADPQAARALLCTLEELALASLERACADLREALEQDLDLAIADAQHACTLALELLERATGARALWEQQAAWQAEDAQTQA
jgi:hypothetical protein